MRIKMQCPDCGKWFTLELSVKERPSPEAARPGTARGERDGKTDAPASTRADRQGGSGEEHEGRPAGASRRSFWLYRVAPVLALGVVVLVWLSVANRGVDSAPASTASPKTVQDQVAVAAYDDQEPLSESGGGGAPRTSPGSAGASVPEETPVAETFEVRLVALDRCWVRVVVDETEVSDLTLEEGASRSWSAERSVEVSSGSGEAVDIYLDGERLGRAGNGPYVVEGVVITSGGIEPDRPALK